MASVLFVWELGLGLGHLKRHTPAIDRLLEAGHQVYFASRDPGRAARVFGDRAVRLLQAPIKTDRVDKPITPTLTYAHILYNNGFDNPTDLFGRIQAWRHLAESVKPDLVVYDHSPTARLALGDTGIPAAWCGTGFTVPPPDSPMPSMNLWQTDGQEGLGRIEADILFGINLALDRAGMRPLDRIADLMKADLTILMTYPELDHYGERGDVHYVGIPENAEPGDAPDWPESDGPRIFGYLHFGPSTPALLEVLAQRDIRAVLYLPKAPPDLVARYSRGNLDILQSPVPMGATLKQTDLVLTSGSHATTCRALLAGRPLLVVPDNPERMMMARRVHALGAGLLPENPGKRALDDCLGRLIEEPGFRDRARVFSEKHASDHRRENAVHYQDVLEELAGRLSPQKKNRAE